jgi:sigma-E factor negative regulatory protein RseB
VKDRSPWRWLWTATLASCLLPTAGAAGPETAAAPVPLPVADAKVWLARIQTAAATGNYHGTMVFSTGATMSSSRVGHYVQGGQVWEHLEALDGRQERIVRHDEAVHTLWPQSRLAVVERRDALTAWSSTPQRIEPQALEQYDIRAEGTQRVAGRDAAVLLLEPRDALRYAQRFWVDQASGLLLRADVLGAAGPSGATGSKPVLESTAFSEVSIGSRPSAETLSQTQQALRQMRGYRVVRPLRQTTTLEAEGWSIVRATPGFRLVGCVKRGMGAAADEAPVLQAVYTDGLTVVSMFIELFRPERHRSEEPMQRGATAAWMQRRGEFWITAVGDVPPATLRQFEQALERRTP